jgi:hypothetical protein
MLTLLANAGALKGLAGVLLGDFETDVVYKERGERGYWRELFLERLEDGGRRSEAHMGLVRGKCKYEARLDEEGRVPLDGFFGIGRGVPEDFAQPFQVGTPFGRSGSDVCVDRSRLRHGCVSS